jgi:AsmA protein
MARSTRFILIAIGAVVALFLIVAVCLPLFLNADNFRSRIEATLTKSLGRQVTIGKLELSVWSGGLVATNATVADDPAFSAQPFIQADSVKIGVELLPLILSKQVHVRGFSLISPKVQLLRSANGTWNYSTIGKASATPSAQDADTRQTFPDLTVGHVTVENGRFTVGAQAAAGAAASAPVRVYDQVNLDVKNFGFRNSFPFNASAHLPGDGTVSVKGTAGPINAQDASATPFSGHLEMKHIDPLAAGFVDASTGITGLLDNMVLDASWNGQQMHVTKLLVDNPHLTVVRDNTPPAPKAAGPSPEGTTMLENLSVDDAQVKNASVTLSTRGQAGTAVYQQLNAQISNVTPKTASPFTVSAELPGGGSLAAKGQVGPFNQLNNAATPLNAQVTLKHVELATSGVLPADAGISGLTDLQAQIQSNGQTLNATGTGTIANIKLAKNGQPSATPVQIQFTVAQNEQALTGQLQRAIFTVGRAVINADGTYQTAGPTTALNLKLNGNAVPIDDLVAFLPSAGVRLPQGSQLRGGTLTTTLTVSGSTASPVISGPVRLDNTQLAGFDLGARLKTLSQLTGGKIGGATGSGTNIRSLSMNIRESSAGIQTDNIALDVAGVGTATGSGTVSDAGALNYNMLLKLTGLVGGSSASNAAPAAGGGTAGLLGGLAGMIPGGAGGAAGLGGLGGLAAVAMKNGIPVAIGGTTSNPSFAPNLSGLAASAGKDLLKGRVTGKTNGTPSNSLGNVLGGFLNRH